MKQPVLPLKVSKPFQISGIDKVNVSDSSQSGGELLFGQIDPDTAELIVRAVNAHAALIACVETSISWLEDEVERSGCLVAKEDLKAAKAALAMAKGESE